MRQSTDSANVLCSAQSAENRGIEFEPNVTGAIGVPVAFATTSDVLSRHLQIPKVHLQNRTMTAKPLYWVLQKIDRSLFFSIGEKIVPKGQAR